MTKLCITLLVKSHRPRILLTFKWTPYLTKLSPKFAEYEPFRSAIWFEVWFGEKKTRHQDLNWRYFITLW